VEPQPLSQGQFLLVTLVFKLAIVAALATMLVRFRRFRHILIFERRALPDRLILSLSIGAPLTLGVASRVLLHYYAADLSLEGAFLLGLIAGPYSGAIVGGLTAVPALIAGEYGALPFAVGCGFAGGGLRELCPKEAIWHFSPFVFQHLPRRLWNMVRNLQVDWQIILVLAPIGLELVRQAVGARFGVHRLYHLDSPSPIYFGLVLLGTVLCVATPIKIWNNARIEHRLHEQEKLLLAAKISALASQINPHFLFNTLTSISSLIRSQPETARMVVHRLSALLRRRLRDPNHFVTLREEVEALQEYLDIETIRFGPQLRVTMDLDDATLDVPVPSMILQPLVENCIKHGLSRKVGGGTIALHAEPLGDGALIQVSDDGLGMSEERLETALSDGIGLSNVNERLRVIYGARSALRITSALGRGTRIELEIPVMDDEERASA
jgi:two-component system, LytTR family, sensor kinase